MSIAIQFQQPNLKRFIIALVVLLILDAIWLSLSYKMNVYPKVKNIKVHYGLLAWSALALAISCAKPKTREDALIYGSFVGFVSYAVFNGTELAIREDWRNKWYTAPIDLCWGTLALGTTSTVVHMIIEKK